MAFKTLIDASTLFAHLADPSFAIVDCRYNLDNEAWGAEPALVRACTRAYLQAIGCVAVTPHQQIVDVHGGPSRRQPTRDLAYRKPFGKFTRAILVR